MDTVSGILGYDDAQRARELWDWMAFVTERLSSEHFLRSFDGIDLSDPWSASSVNAVEASFLEEFVEADSVPEGLVNELVVYLGEVARRARGGQWVLLTKEATGMHGFGIANPAGNDILVPESLIKLTLAEEGTHLWSAMIFGAEHENSGV